MDYEKIYKLIIERSKDRIIDGYKEIHHIIPKCMGGNNDKSNLSHLTAKEHFICHRLLCEIYPSNKKLKYALWLMMNTKRNYQYRYVPSSRIYEKIRNEFSIFISNEKNGRIVDEKTRLKISLSSKGKSKSDTHSYNIKVSKMGINNPMYNICGGSHHNSIKVNQLDQFNNIIKVWDSLRDIEIHFNLKKGRLFSVLRSKKKRLLDYIWEYV
jgi:hypothetical protein